MKTLMVHIGTEKTGSSYLQTMCVRGRQILIRNGLYFPHGIPRHEQRMNAGLVSAGNAFIMGTFLHESLERDLTNVLKSWYKQADDQGAETVLISSELLAASFTESKGLKRFLEVANRVGFKLVRFLIVLRDPVDQCLSLYKHRAKNGSVEDIATWCDSGYQVPGQLAGFRKQARVLGANVTVQPYSRVPGQLEAQFFEDWLGVPVPQVRVPVTVNPSLTMSELVLLRKVAQVRPMIVAPLYDALVAIDMKNKVQGTALEVYAQAVASHAVAKHAEEWVAWNHYLSADAQLTIPAPVKQLPYPPDELGFSEAQAATLANFLAKSATLGFLARHTWRQHLRPTLGRAKRTIWRPKV